MDKLSFIILRHVENEYQNLFWNECYDCIRKFYKHEKIYIIDEAHLIVSNKAKSAFLTMAEKARKNVYIFLTTTETKAFDIAFLRRFRKFS